MASPACSPATGAPGHLRQQLERSLGGTEIRHAQARDRPTRRPPASHAESRGPWRSSACPPAGRARRARIAPASSWIAPRFCIVSRSTRPARMPGNRRSTSSARGRCRSQAAPDTARRTSRTRQGRASSSCSSGTRRATARALADARSASRCSSGTRGCARIGGTARWWRSRAD